MGKPLEVWGQPQGQISICSWVQPSQWVTGSVHCGKWHPKNPAFLWSFSSLGAELLFLKVERAQDSTSFLLPDVDGAFWGLTFGRLLCGRL